MPCKTPNIPKQCLSFCLIFVQSALLLSPSLSKSESASFHTFPSAWLMNVKLSCSDSYIILLDS